MILTEQKARVTYDNLIRLIDDPDVREPLKYLREREIVHYQRFGEAILLFQTDLLIHGTPKRDFKSRLGVCFLYVFIIIQKREFVKWEITCLAANQLH